MVNPISSNKETFQIALTGPVPTPQPSKGTLKAQNAEFVSNLHQYDRDRVDLEVKKALIPAFVLLQRAGYGDAVQRLHHSRFELTKGDYYGKDYYAATFPLTGKIALSDGFWGLGTAGRASVLLHEEKHLEQGQLKKLYSNIISLGGRFPKNDVAEKQAYLTQWQAMTKLGINDQGPDNLMYFLVRQSLEEMGELPKSPCSDDVCKPRKQPVAPVKTDASPSA